MTVTIMVMTMTMTLPDAGAGEEAALLARPGRLLPARVGGEALPEPQRLVGAAGDLDWFIDLVTVVRHRHWVECLVVGGIVIILFSNLHLQ